MSKSYNNQLADVALAWANSAPQNTAKQVSVALGSASPDLGWAEISIYNPSAVTALTVTLERIFEVNGTLRYASLMSPLSLSSAISLAVPAGSSRSWLLQGMLLGAGLRITAKNDTVLGGSDGFTATAHIYSL